MTTWQQYAPTRHAIDVIDNNHNTLGYQAQCINLHIAQEIRAMAGMPPLDSACNVHQSVWAPKLFPMHVGQLTDGKQVAKSMWQQIDQQLADNKSLINTVDDMTAVCNQPGSWASTKTRHDLTRALEINEALICLWDNDKMSSVWVANLKQYLDVDSVKWEILDHTAHQ